MNQDQVFFLLYTLLISSAILTAVMLVNISSLVRQFFFYFLKKLDIHKLITNLNKKRGVHICSDSKYNSQTQRYDLDSLGFVTSENIIAQISKHNKTHKNRVCYVKRIHSGCMGDDATVVFKDGSVVRIDENALVQTSFLKMLWFMTTKGYELSYSKVQKV